MLNLLPFLRAILPHPAQWLRDAGSGAETADGDPLAHPALRRMSLEALADLPFERRPEPARRESGTAARQGR
jgi:hypothetical protein